MSNVRDNIDRLIMEATKARDKEKAEVFKAIKNEFLKYRTAKNAKPLDDAAEIQLIQKMIKQREDSAMQFEDGGRPELAKKERYEMTVLSEFVPKAATEEEIIECFDKIFAEQELSMKLMGTAVKTIKEQLPGADGALVAKIVKAKLS